MPNGLPVNLSDIVRVKDLGAQARKLSVVGLHDNYLVCVGHDSFPPQFKIVVPRRNLLLLDGRQEWVQCP